MAMASATKISLPKSGLNFSLPQRNTRKRISCTIRASGSDAENEAGSDRRAALAGMVGILASTTAMNAEAKTAEKRDYYQELLENSKAPSTSDLLKSYENTKKGGKDSKKKPVSSKLTPAPKPAASKPATKPSYAASKPAASKPSYATTTAKKSSTVAASAGGVAALNPVEVGVGAVIVGALALVGRKPSSKESSGTAMKKTTPPAPAKKGTVVRSTPPLPPPKAKPAPARGTVARGGTVVRGGTVAKSVGTVVKSAGTVRTPPTTGTIRKPAPGIKNKDGKEVVSSDTAANIGVIAIGLTLFGLLTASTAPKTPSANPIPPKVTKTVVKEVKKVAEVKKAPEVKAPAPAPAPTAEAKNEEPKKEEEKPAPVVAAKPAASDVAPASPKPTTAAPSTDSSSSVVSNPLVLIGGSIGAILVGAIALGGGEVSDAGGDGSTQPSGTAAPAGSGEEAAKKRAAEARAWIENWKAKSAGGSASGGDVPDNVSEARAWIAAWKKKHGK